MPPAFQYHPLDRSKPSIRLLRILPDLSNDGLIQCKLWHDEVTARYDCLSYGWGSDNHQAVSQNEAHVLVNGAVFHVRHNLHGFMMVARTKCAAPQHTFWIDAMCIDQNSVAERNHQVAQVGSIYSNAREVIAWLGYSPRIERALKYCLYFARRNPQSQLEAWEIWNDRFSLIEEWTELQEHAYWRRAWITHEIVFARKFKLLINHFEVEPVRFSAIGILLPNITLGKLFNTYLEVLCGKRNIANLSLLDLLNEVPGRESQIPRDRIYSLLSIASDAANVPIDYASLDSSLFLSLLSIYR
ncbi:heterokaryon incompatibility protein-domain-containing protein, partial [Paraphoma chrysanthemicola]